MKWFIILWAAPVALLLGWYGLSYNDISFGFFMLTRQTHDLVFAVYGNALGLPPETIPPLVARAIAVDSLIVFAIIAFRRRKKIAAWWRARHDARVSSANASPLAASSLASNDSLSSAP